jgi:alanine-glyoxylate transaminase/(R)-3-amino-2-methylpropionate-pyruvate transaminase
MTRNGATPWPDRRNSFGAASSEQSRKIAGEYSKHRNQILAGLERLKAKHSFIGDVRSKGLLLGIELLKDRATKEGATSKCAVLENCRDMGLLLGKGGLHGQTIRFSPPMCLHEQDADFLLDVLDRSFSVI